MCPIRLAAKGDVVNAAGNLCLVPRPNASSDVSVASFGAPETMSPRATKLASRGTTTGRLHSAMMLANYLLGSPDSTEIDRAVQVSKASKKSKLQKLARRGKPIQQVAALPYRLTTDGHAEILLLTSRQTKRFILPKGWPMKGRRDCEAAAKEAVEEAGVVGSSHEISIGSFHYWKRLKGSFVSVTVEVYPLRVDQELDKWKERKFRRRAWLKPSQAALLVDEPELISMLERTFGSTRQAPAREVTSTAAARR